jgi:hypothetical protein
MNKNTDASLEQLDKWIDECNTGHPRCGRARLTRMDKERHIPTRLIQLTGTNPESGRLRLVETSQWTNQQKSKPYMTLSHCWGTLKMFCTTPSNVKEHLRVGIKLDSLPRTFNDVMRLAWRLKISYVWIDSICVIQDDNGKDFNIEAQ